MAIKVELIEELLSGRDPKEVFSPDRLLDELKKAVAERVLNAELDHQLGEGQAGRRRNRGTTATAIAARRC